MRTMTKKLYIKKISIEYYALTKASWITVGMIPVLMSFFNLLNKSTIWLIIISAVIVPSQIIDVYAQVTMKEKWRGIKITHN